MVCDASCVASVFRQLPLLLGVRTVDDRREVPDRHSGRMASWGMDVQVHSVDCHHLPHVLLA